MTDATQLLSGLSDEEIAALASGDMSGLAPDVASQFGVEANVVPDTETTSIAAQTTQTPEDVSAFDYVREGLGAVSRNTVGLIPGARDALNIPERGEFVGENNPHAQAMDTFAGNVVFGGIGGAGSRYASRKILQRMGDIPPNQRRGLGRSLIRLLGQGGYADDLVTAGGFSAAQITAEQYFDVNPAAATAIGLGGAIISGSAYAKTINALHSAGREMLEEAIDYKTFSEASSGLFTALEKSGIRADTGSRAKAQMFVRNFADQNSLRYLPNEMKGRSLSPIENTLAKIDDAASNDRLTFSTMIAHVRSLRAKYSGSTSEYADTALQLAAQLEKQALELDISPEAIKAVDGVIKTSGESVEEVFKTAKAMYQRTATADAIEGVIEKAVTDGLGGGGRQADWSQSMRNGLVSLLDGSHPQSSFLTQPQRTLIRKLADQDTRAEDVANALSKLGINSEDWVKGRIIGLVGTGGGAATGAGFLMGGTPGAVASGSAFFSAVAVGSIASQVSKRLMDRNIRLSRNLILAGKDAGKIAQSYRASGGKDPLELAALLVRNNVDVGDARPLFKDSKWMTDALYFAGVWNAFIREEQSVPEVPPSMQAPASGQ